MPRSRSKRQSGSVGNPDSGGDTLCLVFPDGGKVKINLHISNRACTCCRDRFKAEIGQVLCPKCKAAGKTPKISRVGQQMLVCDAGLKGCNQKPDLLPHKMLCSKCDAVIRQFYLQQNLRKCKFEAKQSLDSVEKDLVSGQLRRLRPVFKKGRRLGGEKPGTPK